MFDGRVSRYIDADLSHSLSKDRDLPYSEDPRNITFQTILDQTLQTRAPEEIKEIQEKQEVQEIQEIQEMQPPRAEPEEFSSRPVSGVEFSNSLTAPALALTPPSPKERPKSDNFETPPWIPIKV